jgi:hypothetical protein
LNYCLQAEYILGEKSVTDYETIIRAVSALNNQLQVAATNKASRNIIVPLVLQAKARQEGADEYSSAAESRFPE